MLIKLSEPAERRCYLLARIDVDGPLSLAHGRNEASGLSDQDRSVVFLTGPPVRTVRRNAQTPITILLYLEYQL